MDALLQWVMTFLVNNPNFAVLLTGVGFLRLIFKPIMTAIHAIVAATATTKDDEALAKAESSKVYLAIVWLLDYLASVKLPK